MSIVKFLQEASHFQFSIWNGISRGWFAYMNISLFINSQWQTERNDSFFVIYVSIMQIHWTCSFITSLDLELSVLYPVIFHIFCDSYSYFQHESMLSYFLQKFFSNTCFAESAYILNCQTWWNVACFNVTCSNVVLVDFSHAEFCGIELWVAELWDADLSHTSRSIREGIIWFSNFRVLASLEMAMSCLKFWRKSCRQLRWNGMVSWLPWNIKNWLKWQSIFSNSQVIALVDCITKTLFWNFEMWPIVDWNKITCSRPEIDWESS
jgi:hypothetical protein